MSFDSGIGALYVGDVGQGAREEITVVTSAGANLGWPMMEGTICRPPTTGCTTPGDYVGPIHDYQQSSPRSVVGGYVYRGADLPDMVGTYFYGDFYEGGIRTFLNVGGVATDHTDWSTQLGQIPLLASFGTDGANELYAVSMTGSIYRFMAGATRIAGANRYATSAAVAAYAFDDPSVAYVVTGENWPDALMAGSRGDGPVLLTRGDSLPGEIRNELARIASLDEIFVIGGTAAVSNSVLTQLAPHAAKVTRISGSNRYGTATAFSSRFNSSATVVYIATGENHPDALVTAAAAGRRSAPLLLTRAGGLPSETIAELTRLSPTEIILVGGESVISASVADVLKAYAPTVRRIAGANRYATAAAVSDDTFSPGVSVYAASGITAPDALVAAAAAVAAGGPVVLVTGTSVPSPTASELTRLRPTDITLVGGVAAVDRQTQADLAAFLD
jgi:putative cell wall-binding protein